MRRVVRLQQLRRDGQSSIERQPGDTLALVEHVHAQLRAIALQSKQRLLAAYVTAAPSAQLEQVDCETLQRLCASVNVDGAYADVCQELLARMRQWQEANIPTNDGDAPGDVLSFVRFLLDVGVSAYYRRRAEE